MAAGKHGLSEEEVAAAMLELVEAGEAVTIRSVLAKTGYGSLSTISKHMKAVRAGSMTHDLRLAAFPDRLKDLCQEMGTIMEELAVKRVAQEKGALENEREALAEQRKTLLHENEISVQALQAEQRASNEIRQRLANALRELEDERKQLNELRPLKAKAELLNEQLTVRLHEANEKAKQLQHHIDHSDAQFTKQRQRDADEHARKVGALESDLSSIRASELRLTEHLGNANREIDKLTTGQQAALQRAHSAEAKQAELQALIADLSIEQTASKKREADREHRLNTAVSERDATAYKLTALQDQLIEAQSNNEKLRQGHAAERRSVIVNLVEHSRRVYELARSSANKGNPELQELGIAQREIERLFLSAK